MFVLYASYDFTQLTLSDIDAEGSLDVLVPDPRSDVILIFMGKGDGTLGAERAIPGGSGVEAVAASDFDGDGSIDLALLNNLDRTAGILHGRGDGSFVTQTRSPVAAGLFPVDMVISDLDRDGTLDAAALNLNGSVVSLHGSGDGAFSVKQSLSVVPSSFGLDSADFNQDGLLDLVISDGSPTEMSVLLGNGDGTFNPDQRIATGGSRVNVIAGDADSDGTTDLIGASNPFPVGVPSILMFRGKGDGTIFPATTLQFARNPGSLNVADLDFDGDLDIVFTEFSSSPIISKPIVILFGAGDETFSLFQRFNSGTSAFQAGELTVLDVNGDLVPDIFEISSNGLYSVMLGNDDRPFVPLPPGNVKATFGRASAADVNIDGFLDLVFAGSGSTIIVLTGNGDGAFGTPVPYGVASNPFGVSTGDFNADGFPDIAAVRDNNNVEFISVLPRQQEQGQRSVHALRVVAPERFTKLRLQNLPGAATRQRVLRARGKLSADQCLTTEFSSAISPFVDSSRTVPIPFAYHLFS